MDSGHYTPKHPTQPNPNQASHVVAQVPNSDSHLDLGPIIHHHPKVRRAISTDILPASNIQRLPLLFTAIQHEARSANPHR